MALTSAQQIKLITLLGWPAKSLDSTSTSYYSVLYYRITDLATNDDLADLVTDYMTRLATMDGQLTKAIARAGVKQIDDIEFFGDERGSSEFSLLRGERKRLLTELAGILDIRLGPGIGGGSMLEVCV